MMAIPTYQEIMLPLLRLASDGAEHRTRDAVAEIARGFHLSDDELSKLTPGGQDYVFANRYGWARTYLKKAGLISYTGWGRFQITDVGLSLLSENPSKIDLAILKRYPEFIEFYGGKTEEAVDPLPEQDETPEELIASAHATLRRTIQSELLAKIVAGSPQAFEQLVIKLLTSMGYGGSVADAGKALGRPHDGGIDGVIKEDPLGLDAIYVQAKRWRDATVGSADVQSFVGALVGRRARKGVYITTSRFSKEAIAYAASIEQKVVLIDGDELTALMFDHGLGVATVQKYEVKRLDTDFFEDEVVTA